MRAARVFPLGPIRALVHVQRWRRTDIPGRFGAQHRPPVRRQRLHPYRMRQSGDAGPRRLARGRVRTALPVRCPIAGAGMVGTDIAVGHHRAHLVCRLPVGRDALRRQSQHPRGQTVNPHARQEQKAMVVDHLREVPGPRVRGPADEVVACLLMPARSAKPDTAKASMDRRTHPVAQLTARRASPALRMMRRHHRLPATAVRVPRHRRQCHRAQFGNPAAKGKVWAIRRSLAVATPPAKRYPRCRQLKPEFVRENRQGLACRADTVFAPITGPALQSTKISGKRVPRAAFLGNRIAKPPNRLSPKLVEADMHDRRCNRISITESTVGRCEGSGGSAFSSLYLMAVRRRVWPDSSKAGNRQQRR